MGGTGSRPATASSTTDAEWDAAEQQGGGAFVISESLQEKMALEFQNEQVVKLFGRQLEKIGEKKAAAYKEAMEQKAMLEAKMGEYRKRNEAVQAKLNSTIEGLEDKFTDASNIVEYDISQMEKKYLIQRNPSDGGDGSSTHQPPIPCFYEQVDITACYKNEKAKLKNDPFACDAFIRALSECTDKTITTDK